ncbi:MAG: M28 family peptidase [Pseudomonadota bacterium]
MRLITETRLLLVALIATLALAARARTPPAASGYAPQHFDGDRLLALVETLSDDRLKGREAGTPGNAAARAVLVDEMLRIGLAPIGGTFEHPFTYGDMRGGGPDQTGINLVGAIEGTSDDTRTIVVSAHYDHLGVRNGAIYNGADDNASGVGAVLAIARFFLEVPPGNDVLIVLFDAEEKGLAGAAAFVADPPVPKTRIAFNLNLDMVSKSDRGELYAVGTYHRPILVPLVKEIAEQAPVKLLMGHDRPEDGDQDWTLLSDHGPFHRAGIPFLYLGVEDHPEYHQPTDDFDTIPVDFFLAATDTAVLIAKTIDERLDALFEEGLGADPAP